MAALLVAMSVMAVALSVALPVWQTAAQREREAELVFRGEQYARAVMLFQRKYANALPPSVDVLMNERLLRKRYKDPITGEDFRLVGPGTPLPGVQGSEPGAGAQGGLGGTSASGGGTPATGTSATGTSATGMSQEAAVTRGALGTLAREKALGTLARETGGTPAGGILGVVSTSTDRSFRLYNGRDRYNEWVFLATEMSAQPGGGQGTPQPGGRGQPPPGGRGQPLPGMGGQGALPGRGAGAGPR